MEPEGKAKVAMANTTKDPLLSQQGQPNLADPTGGMSTTSVPSPQPTAQPTPTQASTTTATPQQTVQTTSAPATGGQTPWSMPAPPPMPPPADYSQLNQQVVDYSANWMNNPNRYLSDLAQAQRAEMDARLSRQRTEGTRNIEEWAAGRGLIGSQGAGMEGGHMAQLEGFLNEQRLQEELGLLEQLASAETADRQAAGQYGLDVVRMGEEGTLDRARLAEDQRQFDGGMSIEQRALDLQERGLDIEEAYGQAELEAREQMQERDIASRERMLGQELTQRENEFARSHGLDEQEFRAQQDRFMEEVGLRREEMAQADEHFRAALDDDQAARAMDSELRNRAMDLQEQGMTADQAYRQAALAQEEELEEARLALQEQGLEADDAYRYAALNQDAGFRQRALDLQEEGMGLDEAYRQAELELRERDSDRNYRLSIFDSILDALGLGELDAATIEELFGGSLDGLLDGQTDDEESWKYDPKGDWTPWRS